VQTPESTPEPTQTPPSGNQPPQVVIVRLSAQPALATTLVAVATDAANALVGVAVDWGDGQTEEFAARGGNFTPSHTYAAAGTYVVTVIALDAGGQEVRASREVAVAE
jgi:hypothetical protein